MSDAQNPKKDPKMLICFCYGITLEEIEQAIQEGAVSVSDIQAKTLASTGCGGCMPEVEQILEEKEKKACDKK